MSRHVFVIRKTWRGKWSFADDAQGGRQLWAERRARGEWVEQLVFWTFPDETDHGGVAGLIKWATGAPFVALAVGAVLQSRYEGHSSKAGITVCVGLLAMYWVDAQQVAHLVEAQRLRQTFPVEHQ